MMSGGSLRAVSYIIFVAALDSGIENHVWVPDDHETSMIATILAWIATVVVLTSASPGMVGMICLLLLVRSPERSKMDDMPQAIGMCEGKREAPVGLYVSMLRKVANPFYMGRSTL